MFRQFIQILNSVTLPPKDVVTYSHLYDEYKFRKIMILNWFINQQLQLDTLIIHIKRTTFTFHRQNVLYLYLEATTPIIVPSSERHPVSASTTTMPSVTTATTTGRYLSLTWNKNQKQVNIFSSDLLCPHLYNTLIIVVGPQSKYHHSHNKEG